MEAKVDTAPLASFSLEALPGLLPPSGAGPFSTVLKERARGLPDEVEGQLEQRLGGGKTEAARMQNAE